MNWHNGLGLCCYAYLDLTNIHVPCLRLCIDQNWNRPQSEVDELMKAADLFLLPSEREGLSMAILEALAAGLPTVISDLETNREATDDGRVAWLVRPHAPAELAGTLEEILGNPEAMRARAVEAIAFVNEKFSFQRVVDEYSSAYEALSASKRNARSS